MVARQAEVIVRGAGGVEAMQRFSRTENNVCGCISTTLGFRLAQCRSGRDAESQNSRLVYRVANGDGVRGGFAKVLIGGQACTSQRKRAEDAAFLFQSPKNGHCA